jgi:acyl-CoA reductase-like NAD-dependent aldehyde dehydrogenase
VAITKLPMSDASGALLPAQGLPSGLSHASLLRLASQVVTVAPRAKLTVTAPFTLEPLGEIPRCDRDDVEAAVRRARSAQAAWSATPARARARVLLEFHDQLLARRDQVLDLIQLESGKARRDALEEVFDTALVSRHYGIHGPGYLRPRRYGAGTPWLARVLELHHPVGVVGVIAPWNFPLILSITDVLAALVAGNAAVLLPDPQSSLTALWAAALLHECGLPSDVLTVVTGPGAELGPALIADVDFLMFTGSTRTGRIVAREAAERLIGVSLELGGKNPMLVLDDADLELAVEGAIRGAFVGAGQVCVSIERLYVHRAIWNPFVSQLVDRTGALRLRASLDYDADVGSMTTERQMAVVESHVRDAVAKGANVLTGGRPRPDIGPLFYEPTVLSNVQPGMLACGEETFGPVVSVYPFDSIDEAVALANDTRYGLNASVWSRNLRRARSVAARIQAGSVNVNQAYAATWASTSAPIGGMKESGRGRRHGREGILKYTEAQTIATPRLLPFVPPRFMSGPAFERLLSRFLMLVRRSPGLR